MTGQRAASEPKVNLAGLILGRGDDARLALIDLADGARHWTYGALREAVEAFASACVQAGVAEGESVGIIAENGAAYLIAYLGAMQAGAVAAPINYRLPAQTIDFVLDDCGARLCIVDAERRDLPGASRRTVVIGDSSAAGFEAFLAQGRGQPASPRPAAAAAEILYTSGSTGRPKGVVLSHTGQAWALDVHRREEMAQGERTLIVAPMYHMNALFNLSVCLINGVEVVLAPRFDAGDFLRAASHYRCTLLSGIPTMFAMMARQGALLGTLDLSSVVSISIGSAPLTEALVARVRDMFPNAAVTNGYGTTEAGPSIFGPHPEGLPRPLLSIGHPIADVEVRLAGDTPDEGVLQVRTPALLSEYLNLPDVTREKLMGGWYDTGDIMRRDADGFFYFVGRADDMFVCGGENVFPGEVEKMLERHPSVLQAAVVSVPDDLKGAIPIAFVVLRDPKPTLDELKAFALANGPAYSHPRAFVVVDELPVASTHKLDKRPLQAPALEVARTLAR